MSLLSPEGLIMMFLAGLLDLFGLICLILDVAFGIGEVLSYIPDVIGIVFFGSWILMRSLASGKTMEESKEQASKKMSEIMESGDKRRKAIEEKRMALREQRGKAKTAKKTMMKTGGKAGRRFGLAAICELCPLLGNIFPSWSILVYLEAKNS